MVMRLVSASPIAPGFVSGPAAGTSTGPGRSDAVRFIAYSRCVTRPTLRLVNAADSVETGASAPHGGVSPAECRTAADRLVRFLQTRPDHLKTTPIRVLDFSPVGLALAGPVVRALGASADTLRFVRLAESEVAAELMRDGDEPVETLVSTLDGFQPPPAGEGFHVVHTSFVLGSRRELPLLTALTRLGRAAEEGFVWTDRARRATPLGRRRVRDLASRVDLGFCAHKRPVASRIFTLSGWRPAL